MTAAYYNNNTNVWVLPGTQMEVEVILASKVSSLKIPKPLYTIRMRYPRIIHSEVMTHRVFGRNARSSRAVPVKRMIEEIRNDPFVPWHWGKNQKGMQAGEECNEFIPIEGFDPDEITREHAWEWMAEYSCDVAEGFHDAGYHKQICNRLLEPFMYIDVLITATEWENFLWLRDHKDAEPHLQDLARMTRQAIQNATYQVLKPGEWHLPYITDVDISQFQPTGNPNKLDGLDALRRISAARCARISYAPFDGDASYERELERYDTLVNSDRVHASPLEHQATPDRYHFHAKEWDQPKLHGNLTGWIQARKLIPNEAHNG